MTPALLDTQGAARLINDRLRSRQWWVLVTNEPFGTRFAGHLEQRYYAGETNRHFDVLVIPAFREGFGLVSLFLARKSCMPAELLQQEIAGKVGPISLEELRVRDVLFPHADIEGAAALATFVSGFLGRRPRPEDN
jgi:hypothetical protein